MSQRSNKSNNQTPQNNTTNATETETATATAANNNNNNNKNTAKREILRAIIILIFSLIAICIAECRVLSDRHFDNLNDKLRCVLTLFQISCLSIMRVSAVACLVSLRVHLYPYDIAASPIFRLVEAYLFVVFTFFSLLAVLLKLLGFYAV